MKSIYTKQGDSGETGLLYGGRVGKTDARVAAYGTTDEAVSALGLARSLSRDQWVQDRIMDIQRDLFVVGAELATDRESRDLLEAHFSSTSSEMTEQLERWIDQIAGEMELPRSFIIPGASPASGALDLARSITRRAERAVVGLTADGLLGNPEVARYLNRLADFIFMLARYEDRALPIEALTGERAESDSR